MFKHTLLALAMLAPLTSVAKSPSPKPVIAREVPFPDCYPCTKVPLRQVAPAVAEVPFPDCYPCVTGSPQ